jgi:DNA (cytosine-5)-methyltransferase 1
MRSDFTFIDLFAGIGGTRLAFQRAGGRCVFSSEWDRFSQKTYQANFGETPHGDISQILASAIPAHDVLVGGFPCQPFSIAGVTKHTALGNQHGFLHRTQGTMFFEAARIIAHHQPKAFLLENVKHLTRHNGGETFRTIIGTLEDELGYDVHYDVIDGLGVVPQHRERVYIVGFKKATKFEFPKFKRNKNAIGGILENDVDPKYTLTDHLWEYLQAYAAKHRAKGNGFGFGLVDLNGPSRTLSARYFKDGSEILIPQRHNNPRRLTPRECARLMGFPDSYKIVVSDTQAYKQFGNSVVVPVVEAIAKRMAKTLASQATEPATGRNGAKPRLAKARALVVSPMAASVR